MRECSKRGSHRDIGRQKPENPPNTAAYPPLPQVSPRHPLTVMRPWRPHVRLITLDFQFLLGRKWIALGEPLLMKVRINRWNSADVVQSFDLCGGQIPAN